MTLPYRLTQAREQSRYTQVELAELIGVHKQTIWRWEKGLKQPNSDDLIKIANVLQISVDWLLGLDDGLDLTDAQSMALSAWKRGDKVTAAKIVLGDE